jgi:putative transposase
VWRRVCVFQTRRLLGTEPEKAAESLRGETLHCPALKVGGPTEHIHALFRLSKNRTLAEVVEEIKTSSSRWIKTQARGMGGFHWQSGYGGFSVSPTELGQAVQYVEDQEAHHRSLSFQDECRRFLKQYEIDYDERYVWE